MQPEAQKAYKKNTIIPCSSLGKIWEKSCKQFMKNRHSGPTTNWNSIGAFQEGEKGTEGLQKIGDNSVLSKRKGKVENS